MPIDTVTNSTYVASGGECLCEVAIDHGYADCEVLRSANPELSEVGVLAPGQEVIIPEKTEKLETGQTEQLHRFVKEANRMPRIEFIREMGRGYGVDLPSTSGQSNSARAEFEAASGPAEPQPELDPRVQELALTNYVCDRGGDGTVVGNFPAEDFFGFDKAGSADPDHFKVQIFDREAEGEEIELTLFAMKPHYHEAHEQGQRIVVRANDLTRPANADRTLKVTCKRIEGTDYFRSPYLRLVSTETSKARRPRQLLFVSDYWDEGAATYEKHYTEILHQRVEAEYRVSFCPVNRCMRLRDVGMDRGLSLHVAFHILKGTVVSKDEIREQIYKWTRRALAPAHIRPVIELIQEVPEPKNMLVIANLISAARGRHASGKDTNGQPSVMSFTVDGVTVTHNPTTGDSPETTAAKIQAAIAASPGLAGYATRKFRNRLINQTPVANQISDPFDVLILKPAGTDGNREPAVVTAASSTDTIVDGKGGQTLNRVTNFTLSNFPVSFGPFTGGATAPQRILRWNYFITGCMNGYVLGTLRDQSTGSALDGFAPLGSFKGFIPDVGPCMYLSRTGATSRPFVPVHEMGHPLLHAMHTRAPRNDATAALPPPAPGDPEHKTVEFMDVGLVPDAHDATKHLADAPIAAEYFLQEHLDYVLMDGRHQAPPPHNTTTTPVRRFVQVGATYGIVRNEADPPAALDVTDLPPNAEAA